MANSDDEALKSATAVVETISAWVGWDDWVSHRGTIRLDGAFSVDQLEALVALMRHEPLRAGV